MAFCPTCGAEISPDAANCPSCGTTFVQQTTSHVPPEFDHTAEFQRNDISDNKVFALLTYAFGIFGIIVAALAAPNSPFVKFHIRQEGKLVICGAILIILCVVPILGWILAGIGSCILSIIAIIQFVRVCKNFATEAPIVRNFRFLK